MDRKEDSGGGRTRVEGDKDNSQGGWQMRRWTRATQARVEGEEGDSQGGVAVDETMDDSLWSNYH